MVHGVALVARDQPTRPLPHYIILSYNMFCFKVLSTELAKLSDDAWDEVDF
jgi:hypothetical protein